MWKNHFPCWLNLASFWGPTSDLCLGFSRGVIKYSPKPKSVEIVTVSDCSEAWQRRIINCPAFARWWLWPIRGQYCVSMVYHSNIITCSWGTDQSGASVRTTWYVMTNQEPIFILLAGVINVAVDMVVLWFCDLMISFMNNTVTTGTVYRPEPPRPEAIYSFFFNLMKH